MKFLVSIKMFPNTGFTAGISKDISDMGSYNISMSGTSWGVSGYPGTSLTWDCVGRYTAFMSRISRISWDLTLPP